jgi:hypothetical protein
MVQSLLILRGKEYRLGLLKQVSALADWWLELARRQSSPDLAAILQVCRIEIAV